MALFEKLLKIQQDISYLMKDEVNEYMKYEYVSAATTLTQIRKKMNDYGLILAPSILGKNIQMLDKGRMLLELSMKFVWIDVESGETLECLWYANGCDPETGTGKAITYATKYFLWTMFVIPREGDDPDATAGKEDGPKMAEMAELQKLNSAIKKAKVDLKDVLAHYGVKTLPDLTKEQVLDAMNRIANREGQG